MSLRIRVLLLTGAFLVALLGIAWMHQDTLEAMHQTGVKEMLRASKYEGLALQAQVAFKKQVQEWKNVLLRGHVPKDREDYWQAFLLEEKRTRSLVESMQQGFPGNSPIHAMAVEFLEAHHRMGLNYRAALAEFDKGGDFASRRADRMVRGQDRRPTDLFDDIVDLVAAEREMARQRSTSAMQSKERKLRGYATIGAVASMLVLLLAMSRWITRPVQSAIVQADMIADGHLDSRFGESSIREIGNLQRALNRMASQLHSSYAKLEAYNRDLASARDSALEASRLKSQFLANMSHEIRTPLNGVIGMTHLLLGTRLDKDQREMAEMANASGELLLELVDDVLDFARIESNQMSLRRELVNLRRIADEMGLILAPRAQAKGISLDISVAGNLPQVLCGDCLRVKQIMMNLVSNAIKFTEHGKVECSVSADSPTDATTTVRIEVLDTGIGIPENQIEAVFESFRQADNSATRTYGGSGLGLAICKRLAEFMGGGIGVVSKEGQGSRFWCTVVLEPVGPGHPTEAVAKPAGNAPTGPKPRVLVVEDNETNLKLMSILLSRAGYPHDLASDGEVAIQMAERQSYGIILMDCQMPTMDGMEATRRIRAKHAPARGPVILAVTANAVAGDKNACIEAGMDDYLPKPVRPQTLEDLLHRYS